jgi:hypothetical protein
MSKIKNISLKLIAGMSQLVILPLFNAEVLFSYLFVHDGITNVPRAERILDKYWKGMVKCIRRAPVSKKSKVVSLFCIQVAVQRTVL